MKVTFTEVNRQRIIEHIILGTFPAVEPANITQISTRKACRMGRVINLAVIIHSHVHIRGDIHLLMLGSKTAVPIIIEVLRQPEGDILIFMQVFQFRQPVAMTCLLMQEKCKGFVGLLLLGEP